MTSLEPLGVWLKTVLSIYKSRFSSLLFFGLIPLLLLGGLVFLTQAVSFSVSEIALIVFPLLIIISFVLSIYSYLATIFALKDNIGIVASYRSAFKMNAFSVLWTSVITPFISMGGGLSIGSPLILMFHRPLQYLEGFASQILFIIWFIFVPHILVFEGGRGVNVILKSKEYVRGYWWQVLGRFGLLISIPAVISILLWFFMPNEISKLVISCIQVLTFPFLIAGLLPLYRNFMALKPEVSGMTSFPKKGLFIFFGWLAFIASVVVIGYFSLFFL